YITFRAAMAIILSLLISTIYGKRIIRYLQKKQVGESIRDLGLDGQVEKAGTPTMGGIIIIMATLIPVLLLAKLNNIYVILLVITTLWMGTIGYIDDDIKKLKQNKEGLQGKFKLLRQLGLGIIVGATVYLQPGVTLREKLPIAQQQEILAANPKVESTKLFKNEERSTKTTIPFVKSNEFDYAEIIAWVNPDWAKYAWVIFIPIVIFIITAVSNGANLTDGIDGLAAGTSAIIVLTL